MKSKRPTVEKPLIHFLRSRVLCPTFSKFLINLPKNGREYTNLKFRARKTAVSESNAMIEEATISGFTPLAMASGINDALLKGKNMYGPRKKEVILTVLSKSTMLIRTRNRAKAPNGDMNLNVPFSIFGDIRRTVAKWNTGRRIKLGGFLSFTKIEYVVYSRLLQHG